MVRQTKWFSMIADEATDYSNKCLLSSLQRTCSVNFDVSELLMGLRKLLNTKSETIVKEILVSSYLNFINVYKH